MLGFVKALRGYTQRGKSPTGEIGYGTEANIWSGKQKRDCGRDIQWDFVAARRVCVGFCAGDTSYLSASVLADIHHGAVEGRQRRYGVDWRRKSWKGGTSQWEVDWRSHNCRFFATKVIRVTSHINKDEYRISMKIKRDCETVGYWGEHCYVINLLCYRYWYPVTWYRLQW